MIFDVEQHEENKLRFLEALYSIVQEQMANHPDAADPTLIGENEAAIGERAGFTRQLSDRVNSDLEHAGLTEFMAAVGPEGPSTCLTREGLGIIERHLFDRAKREATDEAASNVITRERVQATIREFRDLSSDLVSSDHSTFADHFNHFYEFLRDDPVAASITSDLRDHPGVDIRTVRL